MWLINLFRAIRVNGGLLKSYLILLRTDDLKIGRFMGKDRLGNRYYENPYYFFGRNRWVIFSNTFGYDYDASHIHAEWFRWLHFMTDLPPYKENQVCYSWMLPHTENPTGSKDEYVPYSTSQPKIIPWKPPKK